MTWITSETKIAPAAARVDLADHTLTGCVRQAVSLSYYFFDHADKLMPKRAFESGITAGDFQVRVANP
jgi:hypothetical protein